jgi:hypothetical protein
MLVGIEHGISHNAPLVRHDWCVVRADRVILQTLNVAIGSTRKENHFMGDSDQQMDRPRARLTYPRWHRCSITHSRNLMLLAAMLTVNIVRGRTADTAEDTRGVVLDPWTDEGDSLPQLQPTTFLYLHTHAPHTHPQVGAWTIFTLVTAQRNGYLCWVQPCITIMVSSKTSP